MTKHLKPLLGPLIRLVAINAIFFIVAPTYRQPEAIRDILEHSTVLLIMAVRTTIVSSPGI